MVKIGEIGHLGQKFLNGWLEHLKKTVHTKFQLFIPFRYPKNGHYYHAFFYENRYFQYFTIFQISKIHPTFIFQDIDLKFEI